MMRDIPCISVSGQIKRRAFLGREKWKKILPLLSFERWKIENCARKFVMIVI